MGSCEVGVPPGTRTTVWFTVHRAGCRAELAIRVGVERRHRSSDFPGLEYTAYSLTTGVEYGR